MKKRNLKKIIMITLLIIIAALCIFMVLAPQIPVRESPNRKSLWKDETNDAYDVAYNVYGKLIFKNKNKALKQFKKEYAITLDYLEQCGYGKFSTDFKTLQHYQIYSWQQHVDEGVENEELIKSQLADVSNFLYVYYHGSYTYYFPFYRYI